MWNKDIDTTSIFQQKKKAITFLKVSLSEKKDVRKFELNTSLSSTLNVCPLSLCNIIHVPKTGKLFGRLGRDVISWFS